MQIAGDVKKKLGLTFKAQCTLKQLSLGEGLEQAIALWLAQDENLPISGSNNGGKDGGKGKGGKE
jgi:hypothetical protein